MIYLTSKFSKSKTSNNLIKFLVFISKALVRVDLELRNFRSIFSFSGNYEIFEEPFI